MLFYNAVSTLMVLILTLNCRAKTIYPSPTAIVTEAVVSSTEQTDKSGSAFNIMTSTTTSLVERNTSGPISNFQLLSHDLNLKDNQALIIGSGIVLAGVLLLTLISTFIMPIFGLRLCHVIGGCDSPMPEIMSQPNPIYNDVYGAYVPSSAAYATYRKRSLDYVAPILKTLIAAYEKYGQQQAKKMG